MPSNRKYYTNVEWEELICRCKASGLSDWRGCRENNISTSSFYRQLKKFRNTSVAPLTERPLPDPSAFPEIQEVVPLTVRDETPVIPEHRQDSPAARLTVRGLSFDIYNNAGSDVVFLIRTDSSFIISASTAVGTSGPGKLRKSGRYHGRSSGG